jgi:hypothetical protein
MSDERYPPSISGEIHQRPGYLKGPSHRLDLLENGIVE